MSPFRPVHLVSLFVAASVLSLPAAADAPPVKAEPELLFVIPVDYPGQVPKALTLAESLRERGGRLADAPVRVYAAAPLVKAFNTEPELVSSLGLDVRTVTPPREALRYVLGVKPFAMAQAELEAEQADLMVVLAPNTLVLRPPTAFLLPRSTTLGYSTVHHQNIGSDAAAPPDAFWTRLYSVLEIPTDALLTNQTLADDVSVRFYFNAGSFVVRPEAGLMRAWAESFQRLYQDPEMAELCQEGPHHVFLHQAALAGAALALLDGSAVGELPHTYSYPLFFERFHGGPREFRSLEDVVTMRYEFEVGQLPEDWKALVAGPPDLVTWVGERLEKAAR